MRRTREELVALVADLGPVMEERAVVYDREASFPWENFHDFRDRGLLGLCIPESHGGLGASFADYVRVSEEIGRHCGATGLTFNMHTATMLWTGEVADLLDMTDDERARHDEVRAELFRGVVEEGHIHSQPFSEGVSPGATTGVTTRAVPVEGGFLVTGRKIFASLSGAADFYNVTALCRRREPARRRTAGPTSPNSTGARRTAGPTSPNDTGARRTAGPTSPNDTARRTAGPTSPNDTGARRTAGPTSPNSTGIRFLGVPATADGVRIEGTWDPLGMRGTVSRTLVMDGAFVPAANEWLPPGLYDQAAERYPWLFMSLAPDLPRHHPRAVRLHAAVPPRRAARHDRRRPPRQPPEAGRLGPHAGGLRAQPGALVRRRRPRRPRPRRGRARPGLGRHLHGDGDRAEVAALAVRVCGGQSMLRHLPLERMYRDARLGSLMLPWSAEVCLERLGRAHLY